MKEWDPTPWVAVYGAIVSTIAIIWNIILYFVNRPRLLIRLETGNGPHWFISDRKENPQANIRITKSGKSPITIIGYGLLMADDTTINQDLREKPLTLTDTQFKEYTFFINSGQLPLVKGCYVLTSDGKKQVFKKVTRIEKH